MTGAPLPYSSGSPLADRRFAYAEALSTEGAHAAAADLYEQVLEIAPGWAPAWFGLALAQLEAGLPESVSALERAAALDADDSLGASLHLSRLGSRSDRGMPTSFVRALFDQYAERFEQHLGDVLGYRGPEVVLRAIDRAAPSHPWGRVLDVGCGTGLMGRAARSRAAVVDGVDLSPRMIAKARAAGVYRHLDVADAVGWLEGCAPSCYDSIVAADVAPYLGDLAPFLAACRPVLARGGLLAFTAQQASGRALDLGADMRFSHGAASCRDLLEEAGFPTVHLETAAIRSDRGQDVPGFVVVALLEP